MSVATLHAVGMFSMSAQCLASLVSVQDGGETLNERRGQGALYDL